MVTQASQLPPDTEFATRADLDQVVQTISEGFRSEIEASEQRLRDDFAAALEASEQRLRDDFRQALNNNKTEILLEIERAKVTTLRWTYGGTIAIALGMIAAVVALAS